MLFVLISLVFLLLGVCQAEHYANWSVNYDPQGAGVAYFKTFLKFGDYEHQDFWFAGYEFRAYNPHGEAGIIRVGFKPTSDSKDGKAQMKFVVSTTISGATPDSPYCKLTNTGVTCERIFEAAPVDYWFYDYRYMTVIMVSQGSIDVVGQVYGFGQEILPVGTIIIPDKYTGLDTKGGIFLDDYNRPNNDCTIWNGIAITYIPPDQWGVRGQISETLHDTPGSCSVINYKRIEYDYLILETH